MDRIWKHDIKTLIPGMRFVHAHVATTTGGTLASTQTKQGMSLAKTGSETGRYTCQLLKSDGSAADAVGFIGAIVNLVGPDDAAMTDAKGIWQGVVRDIDIGTGALDGTVEIQFQDADSGADAEVQDGASIYVTLILQDSNVNEG